MSAEPVFFDTPEALRAWFAAQHTTAPEIVLGFFKKGSGQRGVSYAEALDEALCYGWIDGVRKRLDDARFTIRFTPRRPGSIWSAVNIKRAEELAAQGRLQPAGLAAFNARAAARERQYSYEAGAAERELDEASRATFMAQPAAWAFFEAQPASYRRVASWWVVSAKRPETRQRRLTTLIEASAAGQRLPQFTRGTTA
jgi:uncharacterized protein YdeI (YjbR/CyaY-like superfamily)